MSRSRQDRQGKGRSRKESCEPYVDPLFRVDHSHGDLESVRQGSGGGYVWDPPTSEAYFIMADDDDRQTELPELPLRDGASGYLTTSRGEWKRKAIGSTEGAAEEFESLAVRA